ncbi:DUF1295 domain-containing protein [Nocardioides sp. Bht2]|uniref:DUF1295 domain-containing protein n=1 Tax=Nocardioides sp. Bht2 TaxID=3392297 RepID=UPI0039B6C070
MIGELLIVSGACLAATAVVMTIAAVIGHRQGRFVVVDTAWGAGFVVVAIVAGVLGDGDLARRILLTALVAVSGSRLAWHMFRRTAATDEEDKRYADLVAGLSYPTAVRKVFGTQGLALWFVSIPLQVSAVVDTEISGPAAIVVALGVALWVTGFTFETVGDHQLAAFKANPANHGKIMDRGLWAWTRHPNYFGDFCVWWGVWLVAASAWPGVLTVLSPIAMTYFLVIATGAKRLERYMANRPGWDAYAARTPMFIPRPPQRA